MTIRLALIALSASFLAACEAPMTEPEGAAEDAAAASAVPEPAGLSADERLIWSTLNDDAKRQAAEFIANGGTLTQFVAV